LSTKE